MITEQHAANTISYNTDEPRAGDALPAGTELHNGAFRISRVLGRSGVGITYLCRNVALHRDVAIKEFFPSGARRADASAADPAVVPPGRDVVPAKPCSDEFYQQTSSEFLEKARAVSRVWHPNVVMVYDTFAENNTAYMVMKFLKGKTLQQFLEERPASHTALPQAQAVAYATHIGRGLEALHKANVIHGSVHPAGVMLCPPNDNAPQHQPSTEEPRAPLPRVPTAEWTLGGERVVLLDCGLNHMPSSNNGAQTRWLPDAQRAVWYQYAPLELWGDNPKVGAPADVYALGAVLYHMLTGQPPVESPERAQGTALQPPHRVNAQISPQLSEAVMWALELRNDHRPDTMSAFLKHLSQCGSETSPGNNWSSAAVSVGNTQSVRAPSRAGAAQGGSIPTPAPLPVETRPIPQTPQPVAASDGTRRRTSGKHLALFALLGTAIAGTAAWALWRESTPVPRPTVPDLAQKSTRQSGAVQPTAPVIESAERPTNPTQREPGTFASSSAARQANSRVVTSAQQDDAPIDAEPNNTARSRVNAGAAPQRRQRQAPVRRSRPVVRQLREDERKVTFRESAPARDMRRSVRRRRDRETAEDSVQRFVPRRGRRDGPRVVRNGSLQRRVRSTRREAGLPPLPDSSPAAVNRNGRPATQARPEAGLPPL